MISTCFLCMCETDSLLFGLLRQFPSGYNLWMLAFVREAYFANVDYAGGCGAAQAFYAIS